MWWVRSSVPWQLHLLTSLSSGPPWPRGEDARAEPGRSKVGAGHPQDYLGAWKVHLCCPPTQLSSPASDKRPFPLPAARFMYFCHRSLCFSKTIVMVWVASQTSLPTLAFLEDLYLGGKRL